MSRDVITAVALDHVVLLLLCFCCLQEEEVRQEEYFQVFEKKEAMETQMSQITQQKCKAVACKQVRASDVISGPHRMYCTFLMCIHVHFRNLRVHLLVIGVSRI